MLPLTALAAHTSNHQRHQPHVRLGAGQHGAPTILDRLGCGPDGNQVRDQMARLGLCALNAVCADGPCSFVCLCASVQPEPVNSLAFAHRMTMRCDLMLVTLSDVPWHVLEQP